MTDGSFPAAVWCCFFPVVFDAGSIFCLLGHNGSGKTTTIKMLTGALPASAGSITVYGYQVPQDLQRLRRDVSVGVCLQQDILFPDVTVAEHLQVINYTWHYGSIVQSIFCYCDDSLREKDWRCRKCGTQAT